MPSLRDRHPQLGTALEPVVGSLCTGYGGLDLGVLAALGGGRTAWVADPDQHIRQILDARMPGIPNLGDLRHIDWTAVEPVDVVVVGFPCQDISAAGRRAGIEKGARSGLWTDIVAGLRVLRPALVVVENVAALRWKGGGLHRVLGDLAEAGYDALWRSVRAADIGAAHRRERVFLLAWHRITARANAADTTGTRRRQPRPSGSRTPTRAGTPGQLARRRACPHHFTSRAAAHTHDVGCEQQHSPNPHRGPVAVRPSPTPADTDRRGLAVRRDPDGAQTGPSNPAGVRDADRLGAPAANTSRDRHRHAGPQGGHGFQAAVVAGGAATGRPGSGRSQRRLVAVPESGSNTDVASMAHGMDWGVYDPAIRRWERELGRLVPCPTQPGKHGRPVLAPVFVEHLMGLPEGWVTNLPLPRTAQLRALGNGVVPQQAAHAVSLLLADLAAVLRLADQSDLGRELGGGMTTTALGTRVLRLVRDEEGDSDGCSPWACRSGESVPDASVGACAA